MTKQKYDSLCKYSKMMIDKRNSPVPEKHKHAPEAYRNFIEKEIRVTNRKIDTYRLANNKEGISPK